MAGCHVVVVVGSCLVDVDEVVDLVVVVVETVELAARTSGLSWAVVVVVVVVTNSSLTRAVVVVVQVVATR